MSAPRLEVVRRPERFHPDDRRVITRFFSPGDDRRIRTLLGQISELDPDEVKAIRKEVHQKFGERHRDLDDVFMRHFEQVASYVDPERLNEDQKLVIGAYFTMEYAIESAALFNPSMVPHPDQSGCGDGELRFIMSLRATGEGHVSSIVFRTGRFCGTDQFGRSAICFDSPGRFASTARMVPDRTFDRQLFMLKLIEMGAYIDGIDLVLDRLEDRFTLESLDAAILAARDENTLPADFDEAVEHMRWLAHSNYRLEMSAAADPSEVVIFPTSENESKGLEDVRLVQFRHEDGREEYYGTYTAYNGFRILPQLIETTDFHTINVHTLNGRFAQNKGMALFPRKVDGWYMMLSRYDGQNLFLLRSDNVRFWNECQPLQAPRYPWEFVQIGNCGSPIETEAGWLVLTHGVGPMREYCIGASLLDLNDPTQVIGSLREPLLAPEADERDGYVPNVVYSCGGLVHGDELIIPYAVSDVAVKFAQTSLSELLRALAEHRAIDYDP